MHNIDQMLHTADGCQSIPTLYWRGVNRNFFHLFYFIFVMKLVFATLYLVGKSYAMLLSYSNICCYFILFIILLTYANDDKFHKSCNEIIVIFFYYYFFSFINKMIITVAAAVTILKCKFHLGLVKIISIHSFI